MTSPSPSEGAGEDGELPQATEMEVAAGNSGADCRPAWRGAPTRRSASRGHPRPACSVVTNGSSSCPTFAEPEATIGSGRGQVRGGRRGDGVLTVTFVPPTTACAPWTSCPRPQWSRCLPSGHGQAVPVVLGDKGKVELLPAAPRASPDRWPGSTREGRVSVRQRVGNLRAQPIGCPVIRPARRRRQPAAVVATLLTAVLLLAACGAPPKVQTALEDVGKSDGSATEGAPKGYEDYYGQALEWTECGEDFQCATASAPLSWHDPGEGSVEIALKRIPASGQKIGSLLVNPAGRAVREWTSGRPRPLRAVAALVVRHRGFDPRGSASRRQ